ncbi:hypothetical protein cand_033940 [Cryptosporidium andersoni]|uniref:Uncharacterized protein n=1 Tax=Cryptosporidium andersoni TaxID=117008 RepID=A0A1J4MVV3_9CRYT|nr:hypothetical protein cand_033940 [Cryptosporidium andersoni]
MKSIFGLVTNILFLQVIRSHTKTEELILSYTWKISETYFPCIPQFLKVIGRHIILRNQISMYNQVLNEIKEKGNQEFTELFSPDSSVIDEINITINKFLEDFENQKNLLLRSNNLVFLDTKKTSLTSFLDNLVNLYRHYDLDDLYFVYQQIQYIGDGIEQINLSDQVNKEFYNVLQDAWFSFSSISNKNNEKVFNLAQSIIQLFSEELIQDFKFNLKRDIIFSDFKSNFYDVYWKNIFDGINILIFLEEYSYLQLNAIYKTRLIWIRVLLLYSEYYVSDTILNIQNIITKIKTNLASIDTLYKLYHGRNRINTVLNSENISQFKDLHLEFGSVILEWIYRTAVMEDLSVLYSKLLSYNIVLKDLTFECNELVNLIKGIGNDYIENIRAFYTPNKYISKIPNYLIIIQDMVSNSLNKLKLEDNIIQINIEDRRHLRIMNLYLENTNFRSAMEVSTEIDLHMAIAKDRELLKNNRNFAEVIKIWVMKFDEFNGISGILVNYLKRSSEFCNIYAHISLDMARQIYEYLANYLLYYDKRPVDKTNQTLDSPVMVDDLNQVRKAISEIQTTTNEKYPVDIFGQLISSDNFIYTNPKNQDSNGPKSENSLVHPIWIGIAMLTLFAMIYLWAKRQDKYLDIKKKDNFDDLNSECQYKIEPNTTKYSSEYQNDMNSEEIEICKRKYYEHDRRSGSIILKARKF